MSLTVSQVRDDLLSYVGIGEAEQAPTAVRHRIVHDINSALQEIYTQGPAFLREKSFTSILASPRVLSGKTLTQNSTAISGGDSVADDMFGCTFRINGDAGDNEIVDASTLQNPFQGATTSSGTGTVYGDCVVFPETVVSIAGPVWLNHKLKLRPLSGRMELLSLIPSGTLLEVGLPRFYWVEPFGNELRLRVYPLPDQAYTLRFDAQMQAPQLTFLDVWGETAPADDYEVMNETLAGLNLTLEGTIASSDTILQAFGRLGNRVNTLWSSGSGGAESDPVFLASEAANFEAGDKSKLDGIANGAEVNVNADWNSSTGDSQILNKPTLGTAAALDAGTSANNVVQLDGSSRLPAVDGSQLTNLPSTVLPSVVGGRLTLVRNNPNPAFEVTAQTPASTDTGADTVTLSAGHNWVTGMGVTPSSTAGGLTAGTLYYINVSTNTVSFHTTLANADAGTSKVALTGSIGELGIALLYYEPFIGDQVAVYDGSSSWSLLSIPDDLRISLASLSTGTAYAVYAYNNSGTLALESASFADPIRQDGAYVKSGTTTRRFLGGIYTSGAGQCVDGLTKRFVSNASNAVAKDLLVKETVTWNYATVNTWRSANNDTTNRVEAMFSVQDNKLVLRGILDGAANGAVAGIAASGIGVDSTSTDSATIPGGQYMHYAGNLATRLVSEYIGAPTTGYHYYQLLEFVGTGNDMNFYADASNSRMSGIAGFGVF